VDREVLTGAAVFRATTHLDFAVLIAAGEIDLSNAEAFRDHLQALVAGASPAVIVDLSLVTFMDSSGLGVLIGGLRSIHRAGGILRVVGTSAHLLELFAVTGVHKVLPLYPTVAAAAKT
jgi:anti-sigma B factor antagonist